MPIFILFIGVLLIAAGINDKIGTLTELVREDFRPTDGTPGFHIWILAIAAAGSLGYVPALRGLANGFLVLIILGLILSNKGFAAKFTQALEG